MVVEMSGQGNVLVGKCLVGEASVREVSSRGIVRSGECPSGKCPWGKCHSGKCSSGKCQSGNCPVGKLSYKNQFLEKILSNNFIPQITLHTRITEKTAALIDNIFTNSYKHNCNCVSGYITTYISDHLPQFLIIGNLKQPSFKQNSPISFKNSKNLNEEAFRTELCELNQSFVTENNYINLSFETFLRFINKILDKHAPIKTEQKKNNKERKNKIISKPWITRDIKTSMKKRDKLYKQMIKAKNKQQKLIKHESYRKYRNKIIEL